MKAALSLILICAIFTSCEVEEIEPIKVIETTSFLSHKDTSQFKEGRYSGTQHLIIPGQVDIVQSAYREIFQYESQYVIRWWSAPDTVALVNIGDELNYTMTYDQVNTSCGLQRSIYDYITTTTRVGDSIFEAGTVRYRWFYEGKLMKDLQGTFTAKLRYMDDLTPNKNKWLNEQ